MVPYGEGFILGVAAAAGRQPKPAGLESLITCPWSDAHRNADVHPSCRLNPRKNTFFCDPCGKGGGVRELAALLDVDDRVLPGRRPPRPSIEATGHPARSLSFEAASPIDSGTQEEFASRLGKQFPPETWDAFGVLQGSANSAGGAKRTEPAIAFPLPGGGVHVYLYRRPDRRRRWRFAGGGVPDLLTVGLDRPGPVLLCEGEWDAMRAYADGFPVATGTGGASTWRAAWSSILAGREVAIVYDVDQAGRQGAEKVASALLATDSIVRVVALPLPGDGDSKDLSDYRQSRTAGDLQELIDKTSSRTSPEAQQPSLGNASPSTLDINEALADSGVSRLEPASPPAGIEEALQKLALLAQPMNPLKRALLREGAITKLQENGLTAPARVVDAALDDGTPGRKESVGAGQSLLLSDEKPWPESVEGSETLDSIVEVLGRHVVLPIGAAPAIALWILHAYAFDATAISPMLAIASPEKRCGKTTVLEILSAVVPRALPASNISPAALFRTVESCRPTLLVDEADTFLARNDDLRGLLNSGHTKALARVIRTVGDDHQPRAFSTWCPKVIALIGQLPPTLTDRSILIRMRRRKPGETIERLRRVSLFTDFASLRGKATRWVQDNLDALHSADPSVPAQIYDRAADNWRPLLAIADRCGGEWPERARSAALILTGVVDAEDDGHGRLLLEDLRELFHVHDQDRLASKAIIEALGRKVDRPWPEWRQGKPLTEVQLARLLKPFDIRPRSIRVDEANTPKGYRLEDCEDAFARYLPSEPQHPQQASDDEDSGPLARRNKNSDVAPLDPAPKQRQIEIVAPVAPPEAALSDPVGTHAMPHELLKDEG